MTRKQLDRLSRQCAQLPGIFRRHGCIVSNAHAQSLSWLIPVHQLEPLGNISALVDVIHQTQSYKVHLVWLPAYCQFTVWDTMAGRMGRDKRDHSSSWCASSSALILPLRRGPHPSSIHIVPQLILTPQKRQSLMSTVIRRILLLAMSHTVYSHGCGGAGGAPRSASQPMRFRSTMWSWTTMTVRGVCERVWTEGATYWCRQGAWD